VVFVPKNRVLQARITDDTHEKLTRVCSELGCSITDYVTSVLNESFEDSTGIEQTMPRSQGIVKKVSYDDGKTWIDVPQLQNVSVEID
jgi:antitoxin component of RelBE/YafQ-DinJ toxin-antitoxin module